MQKYINILLKNPLFNSLDYEFFTEFCDNEICQIITYEKETLVAQEGELCDSIGFILNGRISAQHLSTDGQSLTIHTFNANDAFGVAIFGLTTSKYPFTLYAYNKTEILYISFETIHSLLNKNTQFNINFIQFLSKRIEEFRDKIELLQYKSVRSRLIFYFKKESIYFDSLTFQLRHTKVAISEIIGVARPSISRELNHMVEDGLILLKNKQVHLIDINTFG